MVLTSSTTEIARLKRQQEDAKIAIQDYHSKKIRREKEIISEKKKVSNTINIPFHCNCYCTTGLGRDEELPTLGEARSRSSTGTHYLNLGGVSGGVV